MFAMVLFAASAVSYSAQSAQSTSALSADKYSCSNGPKVCVSIEMANGVILDFLEPQVIIALQ